MTAVGYTNSCVEWLTSLMEVSVQRSGWAKIATSAISLLVLSLIVGSCSAPKGSSLAPTAPTIELTAWDTPTPVSAPQPNSNQAMARANVHGTGVYVTRGVRQLTGLKWKFKTVERGVNTVPVVQGSVAYFGGDDGRMYAVDAETGLEKWNRRLDTMNTSAPAIAGDTVYVGAWEELYALRSDTGEVRWHFKEGQGSDDGYYVDPVVDGGTVYFGVRHNFYALDSQNGQERWKLTLSGVAASVPAVYEETVYIGTYSADGRDDTYLYALDSHNGQERWKHKVSGNGIRGAVAIADGVVYVGTTSDGLLALDAENGQEKWRYEPSSGITTGPAVAYGLVYVTDRGKLLAVDAQTGKEKWKQEGGGTLYSDPVLADGVVYYTTTGVAPESTVADVKPVGNLYAVDAQSGQELWKFSVTGITSKAPAVSDGTVYFGSEEDYFYAVK